jgi:hypothetical protein
MMFESKKDRDDLVQDVTRSLRTYGGQPDDVDTLPGEEDAPFYGHSDSPSDMNTSSKNQPDSGGDFVEGLESRLCALLESTLLQKEPVVIRPSVGSPIPSVGVEGTSDKKEPAGELDSAAKAAQHATRGRPGGDIEKDSEEELEKAEAQAEKQDEIKQDESGSEGASGSLESLV